MTPPRKKTPLLLSDPSAPTPAVLRWARERLNCKIGDVATKMKKSEADIEAWEMGDAFPTYRQLEALADFYAVSVAVFYFPEPPDWKDPDPSFRLLPGEKEESLTPDTLRAVYQGKAIQDVLKEAYDGVNPISASLHKRFHLTLESEIREVARQVRGEKGLNIAHVMRGAKSGAEEALRRWRGAVELGGIYIFKRSFKQSRISGFCLFDEEFPLIFLDSRKTKTRQIFTLAHELGHVLLRRSGVVTGMILPSDRSREDWPIENFCNRFAGELLVPSDDFAEYATGKQVSDKFYQNAARKYRVSHQVIFYKCRQMGIIDEAEFNVRMNESVQDWDDSPQHKKDGSDGGIDSNVVRISHWGEKFLSGLVARSEQGKVAIGDIANLLRMRVSTLLKLESIIDSRASRREF